MLVRTAGSERVDVWVTAPLDGDLDPWLRHLDDAERQRAAGLTVEQASRFVQARALLRGALGARLDRPAGAVALQAVCPDCGGAHGRVVVDEGSGPFVSLTRSGPLIAVAVTDAGPVGIDIESHAAVSAAPLTRVLPAPRGLLARRGLPVPRGLLARRRPRTGAPGLASSWVRTEAVLKAMGTGLRVDPAHVEIRTRRGRGTATGPGGTRALLVDLDLGQGVAGAVAVARDRGESGTAAGAGRPPGLVVRVLDGGAVLASLRDR